MKKKFLALALSAGIMVMGAGYAAAWNDKVNINTEINTGYVDMSFDRLAHQFDLDDYVTSQISYAEHTGGNEQVKWDIANVKLNNLYPGAKAKVTLKIKNNSTIPVKLKSIKDTRANWGTDNFKDISAKIRYFEGDGTRIAVASTDAYESDWAPISKNLPVNGYALIDFEFTADCGIDEQSTYNFNPYAEFVQYNACEDPEPITPPCVGGQDDDDDRQG